MKVRVTNVTLPARGHMPFSGHRTQKEVREDEEMYQRLVWERGVRGLPVRAA